MAGIPKLGALGNNLLVPFAAKNYTTAKVVWLNYRWLRESGLGCDSQSSQAALERWLIDEFAYSAPGPFDVENYLGSETKTFWADRYGATGGSPSGGSGRMGISGDFNAKGCGATPLVKFGSGSWEYTHGCMWLEEAIREAILSELACLEFPNGAVPVVAIIDTGTRVSYSSTPKGGPPGSRKAIVVRPNFIRPAHFERSVLFGSAGTMCSDQYLDALRVREAIGVFCASRDSPDRLNISVATVAEVFERLAHQIGFGWAHRLSHSYFSSNETIEGELVDFGGFRGLASWKRTPDFGRELYALDRTIDSLSFYFRKFGSYDRGIDDAALLKLRIRKIADLSFENEIALSIGRLPAGAAQASADLVGVFKEYFQSQQVQFDDPGKEPFQARNCHWLYGAFVRKDSALRVAGSMELTTAREVERILLGVYGSCENGVAHVRHHIWEIARWLRPRQLVYREKLLAVAKSLISDVTYDQANFRQLLERTISGVVSRSRRIWGNIPESLAIVGQSSDHSSSALFCTHSLLRREFIVIQGAVTKENVVIFGQRVPVLALKRFESYLEGDRLTAIVPCHENVMNTGFIISLGSFSLTVPRADLRYKEPALLA